MKKTILMFLTVIGVMSLGVSQAHAVIPTIDGTAGGGEWNLVDQFTIANDPNEAGIPDAYDIQRLLVQQEDTGGANDGLYFRIDTYADPTLTGGTNSLGAQVFVRTLIDFNGDNVPDLFLDFNDANDPGLQKFGVYTSPLFSPGSFIGYGSGAVGQFAGGIYEFYLPETLFNGNLVSAGTGFRVRLDNNGDEPDDSIPDSGFTHPVPEPGTMLLMGMGLLGLFGFRKFQLGSLLGGL